MIAIYNYYMASAKTSNRSVLRALITMTLCFFGHSFYTSAQENKIVIEGLYNQALTDDYHHSWGFDLVNEYSLRKHFLLGYGFGYSVREDKGFSPYGGEETWADKYFSCPLFIRTGYTCENGTAFSIDWGYNFDFGCKQKSYTGQVYDSDLRFSSVFVRPLIGYKTKHGLRIGVGSTLAMGHKKLYLPYSHDGYTYYDAEFQAKASASIITVIGYAF